NCSWNSRRSDFLFLLQDSLVANVDSTFTFSSPSSHLAFISMLVAVSACKGSLASAWALKSSQVRRREDFQEIFSDVEITGSAALRSEEHTSELQSREKLVCRLLLEKKNFQKPDT